MRRTLIVAVIVAIVMFVVLLLSRVSPNKIVNGLEHRSRSNEPDSDYHITDDGQELVFIKTFDYPNGQWLTVSKEESDSPMCQFWMENYSSGRALYLVHHEDGTLTRVDNSGLKKLLKK